MDVEVKKRARVLPDVVWRAWTESHVTYGGGKLENGALGKMKQGKKEVSYTIANVLSGKSFSTIWKLFFVRLEFHHKVVPSYGSSEVCYGFDLKGPLRWILRPFLLKKIELHLTQSLNAFVANLERR